MAWFRMMGAESVEYHRKTVLERGDDHTGRAVAYYGSRGEKPLEQLLEVHGRAATSRPASWKSPSRCRAPGVTGDQRTSSETEAEPATATPPHGGRPRGPGRGGWPCSKSSRPGRSPGRTGPAHPSRSSRPDTVGGAAPGGAGPCRPMGALEADGQATKGCDPVAEATSATGALLEGGQEEGKSEAENGGEADGGPAVLERLGHHGVCQHGEDGAGGEGLDGGDDVARRAA